MNKVKDRLILSIIIMVLKLSPMYKDYYDKVKNYRKKYGPKTCVLYQVGAFYEVYGIVNMNTNRCENNVLLEVSKLCGLQLSDKTKDSKEVEHNIGIGFRDYSLEKYLKILNNDGWTVPVFNQDAPIANTTRSLFKIFTPGSTIIEEDSVITNNIMALWLEKRNATLLRPTDTLLCGISVLDNHTGKCYIHEYEVANFKHVPSSYEELERFYSVYCPNEVFFIFNNFSQQEIQTIAQWCGINQSIRFVDLQDQGHFSTIAKNTEKQVYQREQIEFFYKTNYEKFCETHMLQNYEIGTQCFCFLLNIIHDLNPDILNKIHEPVLYNQQTNTILGNHSLKQLNIIDDKKHSGYLSSVVNFLIYHNKTNMGKREFKRILVNPMYDENVLQQHYDQIETLLKYPDFINETRNQMSQICDLEKIFRKMICGKFGYTQLQQVYRTLVVCQKILGFQKNVVERNSKFEKIMKIESKKIEKHNTSLLELIENSIQIDTIPTKSAPNFFKTGIFPELDEVQSKLNNATKNLEIVRSFLEKTLETNAKLVGKTKKGNYVNYHETDKNGIYLSITKHRSKLLQESLKKIKTKTVNVDGIKFSVESIVFSTGTASNNKIENTEIKSYTNQITKLKGKLDTLIDECFKEFVSTLVSKSEDFNGLIQYLIFMDVLSTKCFLVGKYNYCKPEIQNYEKSFVDAKTLRHPLIEHLQQNEIYVPNDVCLGKDTNGILLFGTNAVGKSSLIKSIGISVIMAQTGMYVPCSSFVYKPYTSIFTRILGNDNIFKGLSTFQVEMVELNTILKHSTENSLILGDELCSGTEMISAISIFVSGLEHLHKKRNSFIFATHFHEITKMETVENMYGVVMKHMKVVYNKEHDCLVYDRKLTDGPGSSNYGLEVCYSLNMPTEFLERANEHRKLIDPSCKSILEQKKSSYSPKKIKGNCEMCNKKGVDIHHLNPQENANDQGFIDHFHKNHSANLMNVCKTCHNKFTKSKKKITRKQSSKGTSVLCEH